MEDLEVDNNIYQHQMTNKRKSLSKVWDCYSIGLDAKQNIIPFVAACKTCKVLLRTTNNSTTHLIRHKCYKNAQPSASNEVCVTKELMLRASLDLCVKEVRHFSIIEGSGMQSFVMQCVLIGARYGQHVNVEDMLLCRTAVSSNVESIFKKILVIITDELKNVKKLAQLRMYIWTDEYKNLSNLCVTVHYIHSDTLVERLLAVR